MRRLNLSGIAEEVGARYSGVKVYVDRDQLPSWIEFRCNHGRVRVWQFGNSSPRVDVSTLWPESYPLLRDVLDALTAV